MQNDNKEQLLKILKDIGLSTIQAEFYIGALYAGGITVSKLAKNLGINRTNSYNILDRLKKLNLIIEEVKPKGKVIFANSYNVLLQKINEHKENLEEDKKQIEELKPFFNSFLTLTHTVGPHVKIFEGKRAIYTMTEEILQSASETKEIFLFTNQKTERDFFQKKGHIDFVRMRKELGIKIYVLAVANQEGYLLKQHDTSNLRETKILPPSFTFTSELYIYNNTITMIDIKEKIFGLIIQSSQMYQIHKQIFDAMWNSNKAF